MPVIATSLKHHQFLIIAIYIFASSNICHCFTNLASQNRTNYFDLRLIPMVGRVSSQHLMRPPLAAGNAKKQRPAPTSRPNSFPNSPHIWATNATILNFWVKLGREQNICPIRINLAHLRKRKNRQKQTPRFTLNTNILMSWPDVTLIILM